MAVNRTSGVPVRVALGRALVTLLGLACGGTDRVRLGEASSCGDAVVSAGEECEPPGTPSCDGGCRRVVAAPVCGNGRVDPGEECEDGNGLSGDGCSAECWVEACGNGRIDDGEECDPQSTIDSCSGYCNAGACTVPAGKGCTTDAECSQGTCVAPDDPAECVCTF